MATESAPPLKELKKLKVAELKALLKTRGLEDSGLKDDLVRRLHDARQVADAGAGGEAAAVGSPAVDPPLQVTTSGDATAGPTASDPTGTPPTEDDEADAIAADGDDAIDEQHAIDEADAIAIDEADDEEEPPNAPGSHETEDTSLAPLAGGEPESNQVLSNPRVDRARGRLVVNSNDLDAWEVLVTEATAAGVPTGRSLFEEIVQTHPTSAKVWRAYAECEIAPAGNTRDDDAVKSIFSRCLLNCPSPDLWRSYTRYMVTTNDPTSPDGVAAIKAAFEYTLDTIGEDVESGPLWLDFLNFLRAVDAAHVAPGVATAHAERARDDEVRSAYQRSVSVPTNSVDALYREYDTFETTLDATAGKTVLATIKPLVDKARVVLKERKRRHEKLDVGGLCVRPGGAEVGTADQTKTPEIQSKLWRDLARWERGNPQQLEADTENGESWNPQLTTRINLAYEQSLMSLRFCPDMWLEFASWHEKEGRLDKAVGVLQRGKEANPECALLTFARADIFEKTGDVENAKAAYEEVLDLYENECAAKETKAQLSVVGGSTQDGVSITGNTAGSPVEYVHPVMSDATTLMYVEYMRCCRRVEGAQSARKAFMRARKAPGNARHEIFVISAHMEWRYDKNDKPARNVFELGLKKHILVPEYVKLYAEFLVGINDVANARVLFERAVAVAADAASGKIDSDSKNIIPGTNRTTGVLSMGPQERERRTNVLRDVFDLFVSFEHHHGSSGTMSSVEQRRHVVLGGPGGGAIDAAPAIITALIARHSFLDLAPCTFEQQAHYVKLGATMPRRNTSVDTKNTNVPPPVPPPIPPPRPPPLRKGEVPPGAACAAAAAAAAAAALAQLPKAPKAGGNIPKIMPPPPAPGSAAATAAIVVSSLPAELGVFFRLLPASSSFGCEAPPHVVDAVMETLLTHDLSPEAGALTVATRNETFGVGVGAKSGDKRKAPASANNKGPLTSSSNKPPPMDVFRMRQAKQARTDNAEFQ